LVPRNCWASRAGVTALAASIVIGCVDCGAVSGKPPIMRFIDHIVIIVKENHSFDNYFGSLESPRLALPHCSSSLVQTRCQYDATDIPQYYIYAHEFGYADRYFTDVRGPSWPNDMMMIAAQSPLAADPPPPVSTWNCPDTCFDLPTIGDRLTGAHITWRNYGEELYDPFRSIRRYTTDHEHNVDDARFFSDLTDGSLPAVSWMRPALADSEHPGYDIQRGEAWTVNVVNAVMQSSYWQSTAIFITWDDSGSVDDHISPPLVERTADGLPFRYGYRVPLLVISPYTRAGMVSHQLLSHVSLLRFIESRFGVAPLTSRDESANNLMALLDFDQPPRSAVLL